MCKMKPKKVSPIAGESFFHLAFEINKGGNASFLGRYKPGKVKSGCRILCLTIVAIKDSNNKIWSGMTAFRNKKTESFINNAKNIARTRLVRNVKRNIDFCSPKIYMGNHCEPEAIINKMPGYVLEIMENKKRINSDLFSV